MIITATLPIPTAYFAFLQQLVLLQWEEEQQPTTTNKQTNNKQTAHHHDSNEYPADIASIHEVEEMNSRLASAQGARKETTKRVGALDGCFCWRYNQPPRKKKQQRMRVLKKMARKNRGVFLLMVSDLWFLEILILLVSSSGSYWIFPPTCRF